MYNNKKIIVAASGGFDPLHAGHVEYLEKAKKLGDKLIVILNKDHFLKKKKGYAFMPFDERCKIIAALKYVDEIVPCIDEDNTVCKTLEMLKPDIFAKGGDRTADEIPEAKICRELGIKIIDGLGEKIQSSSELVEKLRKNEIK